MEQPEIRDTECPSAMKTTKPPPQRSSGSKRVLEKLIQREEGMALIISVLFLFLMTLVGLGTFFNASTDIKIAGNQKGTAQALYAAEAGIADMVDLLESDSAFAPPTPFTSSWAPADHTASINGYDYTVSVRHKIDIDDCDGDSNTGEVVMYSTDCYPFSPLGQASPDVYPVEIVTSTATNGRYQNTTTLEVTRQKFDINNTGALTTQASLHMKGNVSTNGNPHDVNGNIVATPECGGSVPSITTLLGKEMNLDKPDHHVPDPDNTMADANNPDTPCEALGLSASCETDFLAEYIVSPGGVKPMNKSIRWVQGDYGTACLSGTGMLIVHTPGYHPNKCDPTNADYDLAYCTAHPPANLGNVTGNCTFKGLVIADKIDKIAGNGQIIGAVISLTKVHETKIGAGTAEIKWSCMAFDEFIGGKVNHKLSWERQ